MVRASRRGDTPSQAVLRFVNDVLASPSPQYANDILGFPHESARHECDLLDSILQTLSLPRVAATRPSVYSDSLHTLYEWMHRGASSKDLAATIANGGRFAQQLFEAMISANDASPMLQEALERRQYWTYRADVYSVLSSSLAAVDGTNDGHREILLRLFQSFFPIEELSTLRDDLERVQPMMTGVFETEQQLREIDRLFESMASFVKASISQHSRLFQDYSPRAMGVLQGLAGIAVQLVEDAYLTQQCENMNASLCRMIRTLLGKLLDYAGDSDPRLEDMIRQTDLVFKAVGLVRMMDKRMSRQLRTQVFGVLREILLVMLRLPEASNLRREVTQALVMQMNETTALLCQHLEPSAESDEKEVLLFELMSIHCELRTALATRPKAEAFLEAISATMPRLVQRLSTDPEPKQPDLDLINAQLVFLSKVATPVPTNLPRAVFVDPGRIENADLVPRALEMLMVSKFFGMMIQRWPVEQEEDVTRCRAVQTTIRLGLNLVLNVLHRDQSPANLELISLVFSQHLENFKCSLKMGIPRRDGWKPTQSDSEIAALVEKMIQNSTIRHEAGFMSQLEGLLPSRLRTV